MKMMMNKDTCKIANILVDGCNMGVKSLSKYIHQYKNADQNIASPVSYTHLDVYKRQVINSFGRFFYE